MGLISRVSSRTYRLFPNMNILHHKSWHIRNKRNIERVRRDETLHAEKQDDLNKRHARAERERIHNQLRGDANAVNALLPSAKSAGHGDVRSTLRDRRSLKKADLAFKKKIG